MSREYYALFNPWHDKLGRFAFKKGAGATQVSGGAREWMNKPVATIGGKTVTRKHVVVTAGAVAAAALAVGATVLVAKSGKIQSATDGFAPRANFEKLSPVSSTAFAGTPESIRGRVSNRATEFVAKEMSDAQTSIDSSAFAKLPVKHVFIQPKEVMDKISKAAKVEGVVGLATKEAIHLDERIFDLDPADARMIIRHEVAHLRPRYNSHTGRLGRQIERMTEDNHWLEEGLTEKVARRSISNAVGESGYSSWTRGVVGSCVPLYKSSLARGEDMIGFVSDMMHYNFSTDSALRKFVDEELGHEFQREFGEEMDINKLLRLFNSDGSVRPFQEVFDALMKFEEPESSGEVYNDFIKSETALILKYGSVMIPDHVILDAIKSVKDESARD